MLTMLLGLLGMHGAGPTVILGHVDSARLPGGKAAFYSLGRARRGDRVTVTCEDGVVVRFTVNAVILVAKTHFPTRAVYGPTQLRHCG